MFRPEPSSSFGRDTLTLPRKQSVVAAKAWRNPFYVSRIVVGWVWIFIRKKQQTALDLLQLCNFIVHIFPFL